MEPDPAKFIIESERHGIPQARHRLILLGVRSDLGAAPFPLPISKHRPSLWSVIGNLPKVRSRLSNREDSGEAWARAIKQSRGSKLSADGSIDQDVWRALRMTFGKLTPSLDVGGEFVASRAIPRWQRTWFYDPKLQGVCNHSSRSHIVADLWRYIFAACFAQVRGRSPLLTDFPKSYFRIIRTCQTSALNWFLLTDSAFRSSTDPRRRSCRISLKMGITSFTRIPFNAEVSP